MHFPRVTITRIHRLVVLLTGLVAGFVASNALALTPDQIALIVNGAEPRGMELARFYAAQRGISPDRIIVLDLPLTEEMTFDRYERSVTPVVRQFLRDHQLEQQIRCLVTFFGVPIRISARVNALRDTIELNRLRDLNGRTMSKIVALVPQLESAAAAANSAFKPVSAEQSLDGLARRATTAGQTIEAAIAAADPQTKQRLTATLTQLVGQLNAPVPLETDFAPATTLPTGFNLTDHPFDPNARATLRDLARRSGLFSYARTLQSQIDYFATDATSSAFDNELTLLWWPSYSRVQWVANALNWRYRALRAPPTMMVMRLDAPTPELAHNLIVNTMATEAEGLNGRLVVDSRGLATHDPAGKEDPFGMFDERMRTLAKLVREKSSLPVTLDEQPNVLSPNSVQDVGLYCGWYSVSNYVPGMKFNRGAVGYHVASFEMVSLHGLPASGWVRGLLQDGVVGTVGPVAEPFLHSFPLPEEFFPLLLTGKMTLAEVYWSTTPLASWMQSFIGDPLYKPYAKHPVLKVEDLPPMLQTIFSPANIQAPPSDGR